jgi:2-amino-4-hydroxy-6-hydroxymethyldihydropteridine diphosphokinase
MCPIPRLIRAGWVDNKLRVMLPERKKAMEKTQFVAFGANLRGPDGAKPLQLCCAAIAAITALPGITAPTRSPWYSTAPIPASDQARFVNGVLRFQAVMAPETLLSHLQAIENALGRLRGAPNAARTIDLDIIDSGGLVRDSPDPVLPHPRAHLRRFVLLPLRDVAPAWVHPRTGQTIASLLAALPPQDVRLL